MIRTLRSRSLRVTYRSWWISGETGARPASKLAPIVDALAAKYLGRVKVAKAKLEEARQAAVRLRINALPTLVVLRNGVPVETMVGTQSLDRLSACLDRHLRPAECPRIRRPRHPARKSLPPLRL